MISQRSNETLGVDAGFEPAIAMWIENDYPYSYGFFLGSKVSDVIFIACCCVPNLTYSKNAKTVQHKLRGRTSNMYVK